MKLNRRRAIMSGCAMALGLLIGTPSAQAANVPRFERQLLGIRLMSRGNTVLKKYGSPHRVLIGNDVKIIFQVIRMQRQDFLTIGVNQVGADVAATAGNPYAPGASTAPPPGLESGSGTTTPEGKITFWVYQYPKQGVTNVFILEEEGRVIGIAQAGGRPGTRTARGVGIGSPYSSVVRVYGFPEEHVRKSTEGAVSVNLLEINYYESHGVGFAFLNQPLRGYPNYSKNGPWCVGVIVLASG